MGIREDIELLENKVTRLKVEYEQYFVGAVKREPVKDREEVERLIRRYSAANITNTAAKFKLQSIVSRFNSYRQYWNRTLRAIEEGTYRRRAEGGKRVQSPPPPTERPRGESGCGKDSSGTDDPFRKKIAEEYIEARRKCRESTSGITEDKISRTIEKNIRKVEERYKTRDVDVKVYVKDGKARLAIKPKKKKAS